MKRQYTIKDLKLAVDRGYKEGYNQALIIEGKSAREQQALAALSAALDALMHFAEYAATPPDGRKA